MDLHPLPRANQPSKPSWRRNLRILLMIAGVVALFILILRTARRGGAGVLMAAALPVAASIAAVTTPRVRPAVNQQTLRRSLEEIAGMAPRVTPTELLDHLKAYNIEFSSVQQMGRELGELGLQSQTDYVSGRPERRWYWLDTWRANTSE